eukprot:1773501-Prymnesium_polylepis.1
MTPPRGAAPAAAPAYSPMPKSARLLEYRRRRSRVAVRCAPPIESSPGAFHRSPGCVIALIIAERFFIH